MSIPAAKKVTKILEIEAHSSAVTAIALGQLHGRVLATGGADCLIKLWVVGKETPLKTLPGLSSAPECVKFDPTEESVVAGSASGSLKIWDLEADQIKRTLTGHKSSVTALDFYPLDANFLVSGSSDRTVKIWDLRRKTCIATLKHQETVKDVIFSPHGKWVTSAGIDGTIQMYQWQAGKVIREFVHTDPSLKSAVHSLAFHPNDLLLASAGHDGIVKFWDLETFELVSATEKNISPIRCIRFQKNGSSLLAGCDDFLKNFGWEPGVCFDTIAVGWGKVCDMSVSGNSTQLIAACVGKTTVATYLADLTRLRGKDSPVEEIEPPVESTYRTLPRKSKIEPKPTSEIRADIRNHTRSQSRDSARRRSYPTSKPVEDFPQVDPIIVFNPKRQLHRSPARPVSPSSGSSSSPSRGRGRSISPPKVVKKLTTPSRGAKNVQVIKPLPKENTTVKSPSAEKGYDYVSNSSMVRSQSDTFKPLLKVAVPARDRKSFLNSRISAQNAESLSMLSSAAEYDSSSDSLPPTPYKAPVMPVYPVKSRQTAHDPDTFTSKTSTDDLLSSYRSGNLVGATLSRIKASHSPLLSMLSIRLDNLKSIQQGWNHSEPKNVIDASVRFNDPAILVDILTRLCAKPSLWTLDCCAIVLPHLHRLISHKFENYVLVATTALKLMLKIFSTIIRDNLQAAPSIGVNISHEERVQKSRACHSHLLLLKDFLEKDKRTLSQHLKKECRQILLLMHALD